MTPRPADARFEDVLEAASYAETIVARGRSKFDADVTLRLAGERVIEMLGEAVNAAADELMAAYPDYPWHEPIGMRNLLSHEDWRADPDLIWTTLAALCGCLRGCHQGQRSADGPLTLIGSPSVGAQRWRNDGPLRSPHQEQGAVPILQCGSSRSDFS